ncbi:hypothetical protein ACM0JF_01355 [Mycoplasma sp. 654]|uniref:hypothetical protein n=1 Tax=Mycoplasma sp. 654 TaxID=3398773 RepID=UPI003A88A92C
MLTNPKIEPNIREIIDHLNKVSNKSDIKWITLIWIESFFWYLIKKLDKRFLLAL